MKTKKKIKIGDYIIDIEHDSLTGSLDIVVLDELEDVIESINISNDTDSDEENNDIEIDPNLN